MKVLLPIVFATIAATGNAMFALGQKKAAGVENEILFLAISVLVAFVFTTFFASLAGAFDVGITIRDNWKAILLSGLGLFFVYLGFNLLYSRYGVSQYILYAVISIITTTIFVGILWLKEPVNIYHKIAIVLAIVSVFIFSFGQSKA